MAGLVIRLHAGGMDSSHLLIQRAVSLVDLVVDRPVNVRMGLEAVNVEQCRLDEDQAVAVHQVLHSEPVDTGSQTLLVGDMVEGDRRSLQDEDQEVHHLLSAVAQDMVVCHYDIDAVAEVQKDEGLGENVEVHLAAVVLLAVEASLESDEQAVREQARLEPQCDGLEKAMTEVSFCSYDTYGIGKAFLQAHPSCQHQLVQA